MTHFKAALLDEHINKSNLNTLQNNIRFRKIDVADCMEYICALQEFETFKEVTKHIRILLKINERGENDVDVDI